MNNYFSRMTSAFQPQEYEGPSKLTTLREAVSKHVKPHDHIFLSQRGSAGLYEILRQFMDTKPKFIMSSIMVNDLQFLLAITGLATKVITSLLPFGRNPRLQAFMKENPLEIERWTIHTLILRYMAAGTGVPFLPTRSIIGSSIGQELEPEVYQEMTSPFGNGSRVGMVSALKPDVAIIHGVAADPAGNTILTPDWTVDSWGARASRRSTIVTVEKVISTEAIRKYAPLVTIPAFMVDAVCETPLGAHPREIYNGWVNEIQSYVGDSQFSRTFQEALQGGDQSLKKWLKEWIIDITTHEEFLEKLGSTRAEKIRATARQQITEQSLEIHQAQSAEYTDVEMMAVAAARKIQEVVQQSNYRFIQAGPGIALPATFQAYSSLRAQDYDVEVMVGFGNYGFRPHNAALAGLPHLSTPKMYGSMFDMYGSFLRGPDSPSLGILGIAEIDKYANINITRMADGTYLAGSGGHNDCAMGAGEVLVTGRMSPQRFREEISFITTPGDRVRTVVTDLGILEKYQGSKELILTSYYAAKGTSEKEAISTIKKQCGWRIKVAPNVFRQPPPTLEELAIIRQFTVRRGDPEE